MRPFTVLSQGQANHSVIRYRLVAYRREHRNIPKFVNYVIAITYGAGRCR